MSQLRFNVLSGPATAAVNVVATAITYPLYLRYLGYEGYGLWLVLATVLTFTQLTGLGLGPAVMQAVASAGAEGRQRARRIFWTAVYVLFVVGFVVVAVAVAERDIIVSVFRVQPDAASALRALVPAACALSVYALVVQVWTGALAGLGRIDLANCCDACGRIVSLIAAATALSLGLGVPGVLLANAAGYFGTHLAASWLIVGSLPRGTDFLRPARGAWDDVAQLLRVGSGVLGGTVINMMLTPYNRVVLARSASIAVVPCYDIGYSGSMQLRAVFEAGARALAPEVSRRTSSTARCDANIGGLLKRSLRILVGLGAPVWVAVWFLLDWLLVWWLGDQFTEALVAPARILLAGSFVSLLGAPAYHLLLGLGRTRAIFVANVVQAGTNALIATGLAASGRVTAVSIALAAATGMVLGALYLLLKARAAVIDLGLRNAGRTESLVKECA